MCGMAQYSQTLCTIGTLLPAECTTIYKDLQMRDFDKPWPLILVSACFVSGLKPAFTSIF